MPKTKRKKRREWEEQTNMRSVCGGANSSPVCRLGCVQTCIQIFILKCRTFKDVHQNEGGLSFARYTAVVAGMLLSGTGYCQLGQMEIWNEKMKMMGWYGIKAFSVGGFGMRPASKYKRFWCVIDVPASVDTLMPRSTSKLIIRLSWYQNINADASVFCTIWHINLSVDPGVKYRIGAPTISARASGKWKIFVYIGLFDFQEKVFTENAEI